MSAADSSADESAPVPPAGEEIHPPGPTILPLVTAIAITLIVIGTTLGWYLSAVGLIVLVVAVVRWIRETRRDVAELPEAHE